MGLTKGDSLELGWFFQSSAPASAVGSLVAQNYEPSGGGKYDCFADDRVVKLVFAAIRRHEGEWMRVKRILDHMIERFSGRSHFEILRLACSPLPENALPLDEFKYPEVARMTPSAMVRGRECAIESEHWYLVECAQKAAITAGASPMSIAARVLETDRIVEKRGIHVHDIQVRAAARGEVRRALDKKNRDAMFIVAVKKEMSELVNAAGDAYKTAKDDLGATKRRASAERREKNERLLLEVLGKKRSRERVKFDAKLARAS